MSVIPLPNDRILEIQNAVFNLWFRIAKQRNYESVAGFLIEFKKASIKEFHIEGPQAYWFLLGVLVGGLHDRQLIKTEIDALSERVANLFPEKMP